MRSPRLRLSVALLIACGTLVYAGDLHASQEISNGIFHLKPRRPMEELRAEALRATPPPEAGPFRRPDLVDTLHHAVWGQGFAPPIFSEEVEIVAQQSGRSLGTSDGFDGALQPLAVVRFNATHAGQHACERGDSAEATQQSTSHTGSIHRREAVGQPLRLS